MIAVTTMVLPSGITRQLVKHTVNLVSIFKNVCISFMLAGLEYLDKIMYSAYRTAMKIRLVQTMSNSKSIVHSLE